VVWRAWVAPPSGGDLVRSLVEHEATLPVCVWRNYGRAGLGRTAYPLHRLIALGQHRGDALRLPRGTRGRGRIVVATTGRRAGAAGRGARLPRFIPSTTVRATSRAWVTRLISILGLLDRLGIVPDKTPWVDDRCRCCSARIERCRTERPSDAPTPPSSSRCGYTAKLPVIYGADLLAEIARAVGRASFKRERKRHWALFEQLPELNHNAVVGYEFPAARSRREERTSCYSARRATTRNGLSPARDRGPARPRQGEPRISRRRAPPHWATPGSAVVLGDWTTYYAALLNETRPLPGADHRRPQGAARQGLAGVNHKFATKVVQVSPVQPLACRSGERG